MFLDNLKNYYRRYGVWRTFTRAVRRVLVVKRLAIKGLKRYVYCSVRFCARDVPRIFIGFLFNPLPYVRNYILNFVMRQVYRVYPYYFERAVHHARRIFRAVGLCVFFLLHPASETGRFLVNLVLFRPNLRTPLLEFMCTRAGWIRKLLRRGKIGDGGRLKVLHVTCSFDLGGTQRQVVNLCENAAGARYDHQTVEIFHEHNFLYRRDIQLDSARYVQGGVISRKLGEMVMSPDLRSLLLVQIYKLYRDFKAVRPDIVVGWGHEIAMISFVAAAFARVPVTAFCIRTFNPSHGWTSIGELLEKAHRKMEPSLDGIIVNSTPLKEDYSRWLGISPQRVSVCPNGIDVHILTAEEGAAYRRDTRGRHHIPDGALVVTHVGRFSKEKGQMLLIQAFGQVQQSRLADDLWCVFCGDGPTQAGVREYVEKHGVRNVVFAGRVTNPTPYLACADIYVMPSDFEGMPNAMMEAMGCALPCVSTNLTGAIDVARDNVEALYVDVGSVPQLAQKLSYLVERADERLRLGTNAKERLKEFSVSRMIERFEGHLDSFVKNW